MRRLLRAGRRVGRTAGCARMPAPLRAHGARCQTARPCRRPERQPTHPRARPAGGGADRRRLPWKAWGPYLSERQWGTVREDYSAGRRRLELLHPRPGALARLPLGRGRDRRHLRRAPAAVPRARAVERRRPDPQGADVRPDQQRGQPRRGRQGVLVLPRQHAHALLPEVPVQVSAAGVPVRRPASRPTARRGKQDFEYELLDTGVFDEDRYFDVVVEYAKAAPDDILMLRHRAQPRPGRGDAAPAADAVVPQHVVVGRRAPSRRIARRPPDGGARCAPRIPSSASGGCSADARRSCCSARTRRTTSGCSARPNASPYVKDAINDYVVDGDAGAVNPERTGTKGAAHHVLEIAAGRQRVDPGAADRRRRRAGRAARRTFDAVLDARRDGGRRVLRDGHPAGARRRTRRW